MKRLIIGLILIISTFGRAFGQNSFKYFSWYTKEGNSIYQFDSINGRIKFHCKKKILNAENYFLHYININPRKVQIQKVTDSISIKMYEKANLLSLIIKFDNIQELICNYQILVQILKNKIKWNESNGMYELNPNGYCNAKGIIWTKNYKYISVYISFHTLPTLSSIQNHTWKAKNNATLILRYFELK